MNASPAPAKKIINYIYKVISYPFTKSFISADSLKTIVDKGRYAFFSSQIKPDGGFGADDTSVNIIKLICKEAWGSYKEVATVQSDGKTWGTLKSKLYCSNNYWVVKFKVGETLKLEICNITKILNGKIGIPLVNHNG